MNDEQANETNEQLIARLAPDYEECAKEDADITPAVGGLVGRAGLLLGVSGWRYYCDLTYNNAPGRRCIWLRKRKAAPVERWKSATQWDALKALAKGERVETSGSDLAVSWMAMRWTERGPQWQACGGSWVGERGGDGGRYRILDTRPRRTFLGRWIEVDTFAEAEPAGTAAASGAPVAFVFSGFSVGPVVSGAIPKRWYWVARIPGK